MRALVVYESIFGNTRRIAEAVAEGMSTHMDVSLTEVGETPPVVADDVELLVVGGPTHAFGLSRPETRRDARQQATAPVVSSRDGVREWLAALPPAAGTTVRAATFDTRIDKRWVPGSAARAAAKLLRRLGYRAIDPPMSFYVSGTPGPLVDGEVDRARGWGAGLARLDGRDLGDRDLPTATA